MSQIWGICDLLPSLPRTCFISLPDVGCNKISTLQHTATHCNTLQQHTATQKCAATRSAHCNTLHNSAVQKYVAMLQHMVRDSSELQTFCVLQCCAVWCSVLHGSVVQCADCVATHICNNIECVRGNDLTHVTRWQRVANIPCVAAWCVVL